MSKKIYNTTICGSFRRHLDDIRGAYDTFTEAGIIVLSPKRPVAVNPEDEFVILETDPRGASAKELEDMHLAGIVLSDFVYFINPDRYFGTSSSFEIGFSMAYKAAYNIPIFVSDSLPEGHRFNQFVDGVYSPSELINRLEELVPIRDRDDFPPNIFKHESMFIYNEIRNRIY